MCANQTLKLHSFGFYVPLGILNPWLGQGLASAGGVLVCQPEVGEASFSTARLCKGFSRRLAMTHCPPYPPAVLSCGGCGSKACQDGGSRAHSPSSPSQAGALLPEVVPTGGTAEASRHVLGPWGVCRALGQLSPWAVITQEITSMQEALAATASDPSPGQIYWHSSQCRRPLCKKALQGTQSSL